MKKKTIALIMAILAVVLCVTLAACGDKPDAGNDVMDATNDAVVEDATDATDDTDAVVENLHKKNAPEREIRGLWLCF